MEMINTILTLMKCSGWFHTLTGLKEKNLIDGIGLQPTVDLYNPDELKGDSYDSFENCLKKYAQGEKFIVEVEAHDCITPEDKLENIH